MNEVIDPLLVVIAGVLVIAAATAIGPRIGIAGPLILVLLGIGVGLLPWVPPIEVDPEIILVGVLPPLLYSAAVRVPAIEFRRDFRPIAGLSVILVLLTALALGFVFHALIPGLDILLAIALGAILSPTDAVATSIVKRLGISRRVITLLDGESLLNDATSLVILRTMVAAAAIGAASAGDLIVGFLWGVLVASIVGGIVGWLTMRLRAVISHSAANTAVGFVVPFAAYIPTEYLGGSGLVAAVVAGIVTGQGAARRFTAEQRLSDELNWRTVELVLEGGVFLVMGLELKQILDANVQSDHGIWQGVWLAVIALGIVLLMRAAWVSFLLWLQARRARESNRRRLERAEDVIDRVADPPPSDDDVSRLERMHERVQERRMTRMRARVARAFADLDYYQATPLGWKHGAIIVWAGMRGVVTLAAAQTLPRDTPDRPLLVFVAFLVAVGSLVVQGSTLPWLVRLLRLRDGDDAVDRDDQRRLAGELRAAAASVLTTDPPRRRDGTPFPDGVLQRVAARLTAPPDDTGTLENDLLEVRLVMIEAMRMRLGELASGGAYSTPALRQALAELDADELSLRVRLDEKDDD